jgi:hypothetical protein
MIAPITNQNTTQIRRDELLDTLAAELTDAAYPIALRYRYSGSSLDLELEIWRALTERVRSRGKELLAGAMPRLAGDVCPC